MTDDTFQDEQAGDVDLDEDDLAPEDLAPDDLAADDDELVVDDDLDAEALDVEVLDDDVLEIDGAIEVLVDPAAVPAADAPVDPARAKRSDEDDDDVVDLDEELHPDDVETPLDALLQEKTASAKMEDDEEDLEEEEPESTDLGDGPGRIVPRRPTEFHCSSCFLLLPRSQLADEERMLCRDCA
jgi:hypothetical protein